MLNLFSVSLSACVTPPFWGKLVLLAPLARLQCILSCPMFKAPEFLCFCDSLTVWDWISINSLSPTLLRNSTPTAWILSLGATGKCTLPLFYHLYSPKLYFLSWNIFKLTFGEVYSFVNFNSCIHESNNHSKTEYRTPKKLFHRSSLRHIHTIHS